MGYFRLGAREGLSKGVILKEDLNYTIEQAKQKPDVRAFPTRVTINTIYQYLE